MLSSPVEVRFVFDQRPLRANRRTIVFVVLAVGIVLLAGIAPSAQAQQETPSETIVVEGVIHIDGEPAWAGVVVIVEVLATGELCGTATTSDGGNYTVTLEVPCAPGAEAVVVLQQIQARPKSEPFTVGDPSDPVTFNALFAPSPSEKEELPQPPRTVEAEGAAGVALVQKTSSVFEEVELLLIFLLLAGAGLLGVMAIALLIVTNRRYKFLTDTFSSIDHSSGDQIKNWVDAVQVEGVIQEERFKVFRWMVEGLVMSFVVIALIALGAAGKIEAQGIVSVLAAMVGYAAGRSTS